MNKSIINKIKYMLYVAVLAALNYSANDIASFKYRIDGKIYLRVIPAWQPEEICFELGIGYQNQDLTAPVINLFNQNFTVGQQYPITDLDQLSDSRVLLHDFEIHFRLDKTDINYTYKAPDVFLMEDFPNTLTMKDFMRVLNSILNFSNHLAYQDICSLTQDPDYRAIDLQYREDMGRPLLTNNMRSNIFSPAPLPLNPDDPVRSHLQLQHFRRNEEISQRINEIFANHINSTIAQH